MGVIATSVIGSRDCVSDTTTARRWRARDGARVGVNRQSRWQVWADTVGGCTTAIGNGDGANGSARVGVQEAGTGERGKVGNRLLSILLSIYWQRKSQT